MSISSTTRTAGPFIGNDSTTVFPFAFKVFASADLLVVQRDDSTLIETTLVIDTDYSVSLNANQNSNPGGSITLLGGALATGQELFVTSDMDNLQALDLTNQGGFYPETINDALDKLCIQNQQQQTDIDRSVKISSFDTEEDLDQLVQDVTTLAADIDNLDTLVSNIADINTVADDLNGSDTIGTVATDLSGDDDIGTVADWLNAGGSAAVGVTYDNSTSGLSATNMQAAVDEVVSIGLLTEDCVANLQGTVPEHGAKFFVQGFYPGSKVGGGVFVFDENRPKADHNGGTVVSPTVSWDRTPAGLNDFLSAGTESDPTGFGCWVRNHQKDVFVSWFGAVGDAKIVQQSTETITGNDDTAAVNACRDYIQTVNLIGPDGTTNRHNNYQGFGWGYTLCFEPNLSYKLSGHNPLGRSNDLVKFPRSSVSGDAGSLIRQNWNINGYGSLILWTPLTENDCLIETNEMITRFHCTDLSVFVYGFTGTMGRFFSNEANSGRNALTRHKFDRVEVYGMQQLSNTTGLRHMFYYIGDNLGDRLITEQCSFNQAKTFFYSENLEAVQHGFKSTSFASYIDDTIFFHIRRHGSSFDFSAGCGMLIKGDNSTLFKTEYLPGYETGVGGANLYMSMRGCRIECKSDKVQTIASCDFGCLEINGITMAPGGLPSPESPAFIARKMGVIRVSNSHIYGRVVVGIPSSSTTSTLFRAYGVKLTNCTFSMDLGKALYVEAIDGSLKPWKTAIVDGTQVPAVIVEGTDTKNFAWIGFPLNTKSFVTDNYYHCNLDYHTTPWAGKIVVGNYSSGQKHYYLGNESYTVLPPFVTITSIKITHGIFSNAELSTFRVKIGSATIDYAVPNNVRMRQIELLPTGKVVVVSDDNQFERTVASQCLLSGVEISSPNYPSFLEIEWRPAYGLNELTTTEVDGVRLTRVADA